MRISTFLVASALLYVPIASQAQDSRSPDQQKQQHPENNPKPKVSPDSSSGSSSQLNQGDVPQELPSGKTSDAGKNGTTTKKSKTKKTDTSAK